jgi:hypothetical protein
MYTFQVNYVDISSHSFNMWCYEYDVQMSRKSIIANKASLTPPPFIY